MNRSVRHWLCLAMLTASVLGSTQPASAGERLLRCATSQASTRFGHAAPEAARHRYYAPLRSAMFFTHRGSACGWKVARNHG